MATRYRITAPVPHVVSTVAGVAFADSVGETDNPAAVLYFRRHGYGVEEIVPEPAPEPAVVEPVDPPETKRPAKSASKTDWVTYWVAQGGDQAVAEAMTKDQLAELDAAPTKPEEGQQS